MKKSNFIWFSPHSKTIHWLLSTFCMYIMLTQAKRRIHFFLQSMHTILKNYFLLLCSQTMLRIWDTFLSEGNKVLFRYALAAFKCFEEDLLKQNDYLKIFAFLRRMPEMLVDVQRLTQVCWYPNTTNQEYKTLQREQNIVHHTFCALYSRFDSVKTLYYL